MLRRPAAKTPQKPKMQKIKHNAVAVNTASKFVKNAKPKAADLKEEISKNVGTPKNKLAKKKMAQKVTKVKEEFEEEVEEDFDVEEEEDLDDDGEDEGMSEDNVDEEDDMPEDEDDFDEEDDEEAENGDEVEDEDDDEDGEEAENDNESGVTGQPVKTHHNTPKVGRIPKDYAPDKIIRIKNIPKQCKVADITELFAEYGPIHGIRILGGSLATTADLAFTTTEAAKNAAAASGSIMAHGAALTVQIKKDVAQAAAGKKSNKNMVREGEDRRVYVRNLKTDTEKDELLNLFSPCGDIVKIEMTKRNKSASAVIDFANKESKAKALEKHNVTLNDTNISVYDSYDWKSRAGNKRCPERTITLKNKQQMNCVDSVKLAACFAKCGEIENMELICGKNILGFITFKTEDAAAKAMGLNGSNVNGIELEIEKYNLGARKVSVHVSNLAKGVTEQDLESLFSTCGEINSIVMRVGYAVIHFATPEAYCKSFLLTEINVKGQIIFLEPFSPKKKFLMKQLNRKRKFSDRNPKYNGFKKMRRNF